VNVTTGDMRRLEEAIPKDAAAGSRYAEAQMHHLDSERAAHA
jgi:hypothetical protein